MFKNEKDKIFFWGLHPIIQLIVMDMNLYCHRADKVFTVTETLTTKNQDEKLGRVSASHREGRAVDISTKNWDASFLNKFMSHFAMKYNHFAAISAKTNQPNLLVYHNSGWGNHIHLQIHSKYKL